MVGVGHHHPLIASWIDRAVLCQEYLLLTDHLESVWRQQKVNLIGELAIFCFQSGLYEREHVICLTSSFAMKNEALGADEHAPWVLGRLHPLILGVPRIRQDQLVQKLRLQVFQEQLRVVVLVNNLPFPIDVLTLFVDTVAVAVDDIAELVLHEDRITFLVQLKLAVRLLLFILLPQLVRKHRQRVKILSHFSNRLSNLFCCSIKLLFQVLLRFVIFKIVALLVDVLPALYEMLHEVDHCKAALIVLAVEYIAKVQIQILSDVR